MRHCLDISLEQSLNLKGLILECKKFRSVTLGPIRRIRNTGLAAQSHLSVTGNPYACGELGFRNVARYGLGAILVYRLSSSGHSDPGMSPRA